MKSTILTMLMVFASLSCFGQEVQNSSFKLMLGGLLSDTVPQMDVEDVKEHSDAVLLDARALEEYQISHIEGAKWVGYEEFDAESVAEVNRDQTVVVYCSVGYRSERIGEKLEDLGFNNVYNLYGGIFEWVNQGQEVQTETGENTDQVHCYSKLWGVWLEKGTKVY